MSATSAPIARPERATAPESAKLLKAALRAAFPATKFSVTLSRGTGYGYCHVRWTDGPTMQRVDAIAKAFEGERYDGTQDMSVPLNTTLADGRRTGLRGVGTERRISATLARRAAEQVATYYAVPVPVIEDTTHGWQIASADDFDGTRTVGERWSTLVYQAASNRTRFTFARGA